MKKPIVAVALLLCSLAGAQRVVPGQVVVLYDDSSIFTFATGRAAARSLGTLHTSHAQGIECLDLKPGANLERTLSTLRNTPGVLAAEPEREWHVCSDPNDPYWSLQWSNKYMGFSRVWSGSTGAGVKVAVLDTGVNVNHEDLLGQCLKPVKFASSSKTTDDLFGHGTHCAGIIGAIAFNGKGIAGVAPGCTIMPIKVLGDNGSGRTDEIAAGLKYAADNGANIANMSFGSSSADSVLAAACNYAAGKNVLLVCAAGNSGSTDKFYPAAFSNCLSVGAINSSGALTSYSNYGSWVNIVAPGDNIPSTYFTGYGYMSGTSMAAPQASGAAALLWPAFRTPAAVRAAMIKGATPLPASGRQIGGGILSAINSWNGVDGGSAQNVLTDFLASPDAMAIAKSETATGTLSELIMKDGYAITVNGFKENKTYSLWAQFALPVQRPAGGKISLTLDGISVSSSARSLTVSVYNFTTKAYEAKLLTAMAMPGAVASTHLYAFDLASPDPAYWNKYVQWDSATSNKGHLNLQVSLTGNAQLGLSIDQLTALTHNK